MKTGEINNMFVACFRLLSFYCMNKHILILDILSGQRNIEHCLPFILLRRNWYLILTWLIMMTFAHVAVGLMYVLNAGVLWPLLAKYWIQHWEVWYKKFFNHFKPGIYLKFSFYLTEYTLYLCYKVQSVNAVWFWESNEIHKYPVWLSCLLHIVAPML